MGCICSQPTDVEPSAETKATGLPSVSLPNQDDMPFMKKRSSRLLNEEDDEEGGGVFQNRRRKETTFPPHVDNRGHKSLIPGECTA